MYSAVIRRWWSAAVVLLLCGCASPPEWEVAVEEPGPAAPLQEAGPAVAPQEAPSRTLRQVKPEAYASFAQGILLEARSRRLTSEARRLQFLNNDRAAAAEKRREATECWVRARGALEQAVALDPEGLVPLRRLADALSYRGDFEQAVPYLKQIVALDPDDVRTRVELALSYEKTDTTAEALDAYRSVLEAARRTGVERITRDLYLYHVEVRIVQLTAELHGLRAAVAPLDDALDNHADSRAVLAEVERVASTAATDEGFIEGVEESVAEEDRGFGFYFLMGRVASKRHDWGAAAAYLGRAIEAKPDCWSAYLQRCVALTELGQVDEALAGLEQAPRDDLTPGTVEAVKGMLLLQAGRYEEAVHVLEEAARLAPGSSMARYQLAGAYEQLGRFDDAIAVLKLNLDNHAEDVKSLKALGQLYMKQKAYTEALAALQEVVRLAPQDVRARCGLAGVYEKLGQLDAAIGVLEASLTMAPDDADSLNALGYFYAEKSVQLTEAEELIRRALRQEPDNGAYLDSLGWVFFKQGRTEEALEVLIEAAAATPDPIIYEHLGDVYLKQHQAEEAARWWERALELDPDASSAQRKLDELRSSEARQSAPESGAEGGE